MHSNYLEQLLWGLQKKLLGRTENPTEVKIQTSLTVLSQLYNFLPQSSANQSRKRLPDFLGIFNLNIQKQQEYHIPEFHRKALQKRY